MNLNDTAYGNRTDQMNAIAGSDRQARNNTPHSDALDGGFLLIARIGDGVYAIPTEVVERIERIVALTPLPGGPPSVIGLVNFHGSMLPVVDPHLRLGLVATSVHPDQHLVVISAGSRYALRIDRVERIVSASAGAYEAIESPTERATERVTAPYVVRLPDETLLVLSPQAFDPGPVVQAGPERGA
jgi:chemotaxis signal transduction protein